MAQPSPILQPRLPFLPWMDPMSARLPGLQPAAPGAWLERDEAFNAQMACRDQLIKERRSDVFLAQPGMDGAANALLEQVLAAVLAAPGYAKAGDQVTRPDGIALDIKSDHPLVIAGRLAQEDMLLLRAGEAGWTLGAGLAAFPASWTLSEKMGRSLLALHGPVKRYDPGLAARIERVIDHLRPGEPVWRANFLRYNDTDLFHPRRESDRRGFDPTGPVFIRMERQTLMRLPGVESVVFTIHTWLAPGSILSQEELDALIRARPSETG